MGNNLFVTGFPYELTQEELGKLFADYGSVVSAKILMDRETGRSRGIGFVLMGTDAEAQAAITKLNGSTVGHRQIFVNEARPVDKPGSVGYTGPERRSGKDRRRSPPAVAARASGEKRLWEKKPWDKDKKPGFGGKKPWEKKPWDKDKKPGFGDKKPWDKMHSSGPKKKWLAGGPSSGRKPGDFKSKPGGFKRKPGGGFRG